jgi:hypothetical protein
MTDKTFDQLPASEQDDFRSACLDAGLAPETFTVTAQEKHFGEGDVKTLERSITVRYGNISREYDGDDGTRWTIEFGDDVKTHVFV